MESGKSKGGGVCLMVNNSGNAIFLKRPARLTWNF